MSRVSDTRQRTRQAASKLVTAGRRPHELTVDLIYAEIQQGSRTTINDELKLWKDEQTKVDALSTALPAPVASAMLAAWAIAVEHGEQVFDDRRAEIEGELAQATERADTADAAKIAAQAEVIALREQLEQIRAAAAGARAESQHERDAKESALQRVADSEQRLASERSDAASRLDNQRDAYEKQLHDQREALAASEARFREELARATERLEGVQRHVMLQVAEAREAQKRAEDQVNKATQRSDRLASELESLRAELATRTAQLQRATQDCVLAADQVARLHTERDSLNCRLATSNGRLEAATQQIADLMARVGAAGPPMKKEVAAKKRPRTTT